MKKVSIVVATYKRDEDLKRALRSLAVQSYPNIEIVLVDDNGDAEWNTRVSAIVSDFKTEYPSVPLKYIVNSPNQGSAKTRNIGIEASTGEYITFLDDDDVYLTDKVRRQVVFMENSGYDYSITDLVLYNEDNKEIDKRIRSYIKDTSVDSLRMYHLKHHMTGTDTMMFKKNYLEQIGGFAPIDVGDEFYLMQRAIEGGGKFGYLPGCEIKAYVHTGEGGLSSGDGKIKGENALYEYKKTFFDRIDVGSKRYIRMRHYAVISFAEIRRKRAIPFLMNAVKAFFCAPIACIKMVLDMKKEIVDNTAPEIRGGVITSSYYLFESFKCSNTFRVGGVAV